MGIEKRRGHLRFYGGFTIVELLVAIVIIGILAAITMVSYSGITKKATIAALQSDLRNAAVQLEIAKANNGDIYPASQEAAGLKSSIGITLSYSYNVTNNSYCLAGAGGSLHYLTSSVSGRIPLPGECNSFAVAWGGAGSTDYGRGVAQTNDGGYILSGYINSYGAGDSDALLAKYNSDGTLSWNKTWGGAGYDGALAVIQTSDGDFVMAGSTASYGAGGADVLLAKYTVDGFLSWNKIWGGSGGEGATSLVQTTDGGYAVTGYTASYGAGGYDMFITKYTSDGTLSWNKIWGGAGDEQGRSIVQTTDGGYAVVGYTASYGAGGYDMFITKYTSDGTLSWNKTWGGSSDDYAYSIIKAVDGGYAVTGYTASYGAGGSDALLAKYASDGTLSWVKTWGGSISENAFSTIISADGGYAVTGYTNSYGAGSPDTFLARYTSNGVLSWVKTWGGVGYDYGRDVVKTNDGGYAVTGYTASYGAGGYEVTLIKYNSDGSITNCSSPMCQSPTGTVTSPSGSESSPSATTTTLSATVGSPSATITTPSANLTTIVSAQ